MMRSRPMTGMEIMKDGIGNASGRRSELPIKQGRWANLPPELLSEIIERVEESETSWPCWDVMSCAAVCKPWWRIIKETFSSPEKCGRLILPISVKQPGPQDRPIHCFVRRDTRTSAYGLYYGLVPSKHESDKLLLSATRIRNVTTTDFVISLPSDVLSQPDDNTYVGKLRSNFTGRKFTIYESSSRFDKKPDSKQPPARKSHCKYTVGTVSYSVARNRPRRMNCVMNSIPASFSVSKGKDLASSNFSTANLSVIKPVRVLGDPLVLMNKAPWWHEKHRFWCLNFRGRVTVASVKNFQLLLVADQPSGNVSSAEGEKVILQFGKIGGDTFTMDYRYPLSAFQAFAICLSSFGSNAYY